MSIREQSLAIRGPMLWNLLPVDIQNSCSVEVLKITYCLLFRFVLIIHLMIVFSLMVFVTIIHEINSASSSERMIGEEERGVRCRVKLQSFVSSYIF